MPKLPSKPMNNMQKKQTAKPSDGAKTSSKSATKTATSTKTSTDAYTQGNITVTGGAGKGATNVKIGSQGGSSKKIKKAK